MPYLISYYIAGALLAIASELQHESTPLQRIGRSLVVLNLWPLLLFIAPEIFAKQRAAKQDMFEHELEPMFKELQELVTEYSEDLNEWERVRLRRAAEAGESGITFFSDSTNFADVLSNFWDEDIPPEVYHALNLARWRLSREVEYSGLDIQFSLREPDWYVGLSTEFVKSIAKIDKNKRARILEAISKLAESPTVAHGDTIKPLSGNLSGLWRYRMGDDRLIYKPHEASKKVLLISFGPRGGIYDRGG